MHKVNWLSRSMLVLAPKYGLIAHDHSDTTIRYKTVTDPTLIKDCSRAAEALGLGKIDTIQHVDRVDYYSINFRVSFSDGRAPVLLRECRHIQNLDWLEAQSELFEYFARQGVDTTRFVIDNAQPVAKLVAGKVWTAYRFIEASNFFGGTIEEVRASARNIGRLHRVMAQLPDDLPNNLCVLELTTSSPSGRERSDLRKDITMEEFRAMLTRISGLRIRSEQDRENRRAIEATKADIFAAIALRDSSLSGVKPSNQVVHNDLHPHNLLSMNGRSVILDFDRMGFEPVHYCLGFAFHRLLRQVWYHYGWDACCQARAEFVKAYKSENPGIDFNSREFLGFSLQRALAGMHSWLIKTYIDMKDDWIWDIPKQMHSPSEILAIYRLK